MDILGCFNLDPNRVLDVILESFENKPQDVRLFVPLICSYMKDPKIICEVLGSKYTFLKSNETIVPKSLYTLTAQLLQNKIISLEDIYVWVRIYSVLCLMCFSDIIYFTVGTRRQSYAKRM